MASAKGLFRPGVFAAGIFASGIWRGTGTPSLTVRAFYRPSLSDSVEVHHGLSEFSACRIGAAEQPQGARGIAESQNQ